MYTVEVKSVSGWTQHSEYTSFRDAVDQADMVHGRIAGENLAHRWAVANQGYAGTFAEWMSQDDDARMEYEIGAGAENAR